MKKTNNYTNKYIYLTKNPILRKLLAYPIGGLASHWVFQGLLYMDRTEKIIKLAIDVILAIAGYLLLQNLVSEWLALVIAFLLAHTLNFIFNGQVWGVLKHYGYVSNTFEAFNQFKNQLADHFRNEKAVKNMLVFGSISRSDWRETSDLDVRLIRQPGFWNGIKVCWLVMKERTRAVFAKFPLDIYVLDSERSLSRLREDEEAIDLLHGR